MRRLCTVLLLAATCLLGSPGVATETVTTCDALTVHRLSCGNGVIVVEDVLYGRSDSVTCSEGKPQEQLADTKCSQEGTLNSIKKSCDGKKVCEVNASVFGRPDPCSSTSKYLQTKYSCFPAHHVVTCEHSLAQLHCEVGQIIFVYGAHFGRRDQTTCTYKRPPSQIQNTDCSQSTSIVSDSCTGKNNCTLNVRSSVFGDPCPNTYKYLEVAYACEYPSVAPVEDE